MWRILSLGARIAQNNETKALFTSIILNRPKGPQRSSSCYLRVTVAFRQLKYVSMTRRVTRVTGSIQKEKVPSVPRYHRIAIKTNKDTNRCPSSA